jgi:hypothetical protein
MFNLEQAIAEWRREMLTAGIKTPVPLEELESHLRDDIAQQIQSGANSQQAFENSAQRMGHANEIKREFKKGCRTKGWMWFGAIGLVGTVLLNLAGLHVFHRTSSIFFSNEWWSAWLPNYIVWTSFTIIGIASGFTKWHLQRKATRQ